MAATNDNTIFFKFARGVTYFAYGLAFVACIFLLFGFLLLLFGANYSTPFVQFIYNGASAFLEPFRGIFPTHQVTATGYFNASALFAALIYVLFAMACHALINYLSRKIEYREQPAAYQNPTPVNQPAPPSRTQPSFGERIDDDR